LVLTSHSMDECEALCTELAIMHIKSRFGAGFTLLVRLRNSEGVDRIKSEILKKFPGAVLKRKGTTWSGLFDRLEELLRDFDFEDYSLSQTTLEQV
uniref:ABC transporter domain-containing protein n=1 Tax=Angiostrongylus cantonensis TaxID=6313 RepID=A0A158P7X0_ANGCA